MSSDFSATEVWGCSLETSFSVTQYTYPVWTLTTAIFFQIAHCLRPIQRRDTISISRMLIWVMDHPTPSWAFRMYPTCILFRVKSWPCVTLHACSLSSKQYYRLYAWSTWNHYQTWVVMALLWKSFWLCIYAAIFTIGYWSWYDSYCHHAHSVLKKKVLLGPGRFPKLKIPLYQKATAISYKPLSQLHTDDLVSFDLLYKAAMPFEQTNKQKTDGKKSWLFTRLQENGIPRMSMRDWNRSNMPFGYVLLMSHDGKIEPLSQCEIKEVKQGTYSLYRMGRYCRWGFWLFLWGRRA